jgi:NAD(P)H-hydrate repair Nnr-like enzyme with NAD(P)H-hydrate epimerase domain
MTIETGYLDAKDAYDLDQHLFANGYTLEQLMELAGLAVAEAVYQSVPPSDLDSDSDPVRLLVSALFDFTWSWHTVHVRVHTWHK